MWRKKLFFLNAVSKINIHLQSGFHLLFWIELELRKILFEKRKQPLGAKGRTQPTYGDVSVWNSNVGNKGVNILTF